MNLASRTHTPEIEGRGRDVEDQEVVHSIARDRDGVRVRVIGQSGVIPVEIDTGRWRIPRGTWVRRSWSVSHHDRESTKRTDNCG